MATKRGIDRALTRAAVIGASAAASVFIGAIAFDHSIAIRSNGTSIHDRPAFFGYVWRWATIPAGLGAGVASLLLDRKQWQRSYTLAEFETLLLKKGVNSTVVTNVVAELMQIKDAETDEKLR